MATTTPKRTDSSLRNGSMPDDIDVGAGLKVLDDPTIFEPGIIWYTAWGKREQRETG